MPEPMTAKEACEAIVAMLTALSVGDRAMAHEVMKRSALAHDTPVTSLTVMLWNCVHLLLMSMQQVDHPLSIEQRIQLVALQVQSITEDET